MAYGKGCLTLGNYKQVIEDMRQFVYGYDFETILGQTDFCHHGGDKFHKIFQGLIIGWIIQN